MFIRSREILVFSHIFSKIKDHFTIAYDRLAVLVDSLSGLYNKRYFFKNYISNFQGLSNMSNQRDVTTQRLTLVTEVPGSNLVRANLFSVEQEINRHC